VLKASNSVGYPVETALISGEVRVYVLRNWRPELAAVIILTGAGEISGEARNGHETLLQSVMDSHAIGKDGRRYERAEDPRGWLAALPYQYHDTYLWAEAL
jgi:hypothetical protein